jgi:zinc/manganese transport system substrate-binding protein
MDPLEALQVRRPSAVNRRLSMRKIIVTAIAATAAIAGLLLNAVPSNAQQKMKVVASFSILGDFVKNVGGDLVEVKSLVGANGNPHAFQPSPADARAISDANVMFVNGLGFEGWLDRLVAASGTKAMIVTATAGIDPIAPNGRTDPHAWQSVGNAKIYVANIRDGFIAADPQDKMIFEANATRYLAKLDALERQVRAEVDKIPADQRRVIVAHRAFEYFAKAYGVSFFAPQGPAMGAEPSAQALAAVINQIKTEKIRALFFENITDHLLLQQISQESGARIGGVLYSDALSEASAPASTYLDLMRSNLIELTKALGTSS